MSEGGNSSRLVTGTMAIIGDSVATTKAAVEQTGQMWEGDGAEVRSEQEWNCDARKMAAKSKIKGQVSRAMTRI